MTAVEAYLVDPSVDLLTKVKIQAQVLVPVVRALRAELGEAKANNLVRSALRAWSAGLFSTIGAGIDGTPRQKWSAMHGGLVAAATPKVVARTLRNDPGGLEFDVTSCKYAEFFRALGEPELGALLLCSADIDVAAAGADEVKFTRTQTLMQGGRCCDFRYQFGAADDEKVTRRE